MADGTIKRLTDKGFGFIDTGGGRRHLLPSLEPRRRQVRGASRRGQGDVRRRRRPQGPRAPRTSSGPIEFGRTLNWSGRRESLLARRLRGSRRAVPRARSGSSETKQARCAGLFRLERPIGVEPTTFSLRRWEDGATRTGSPGVLRRFPRGSGDGFGAVRTGVPRERTAFRYTQERSNLRITVIDRLPEDAQTLHAECLGLLIASERDRGWSHLSGSFSVKTVKGAEYVYFQYSDPGGAKRQFSIGLRDSRLDGIVDQYGVERRNHQDDRDQLDRLAGLLRSAGVASPPTRTRSGDPGPCRCRRVSPRGSAGRELRVRGVGQPAGCQMAGRGVANAGCGTSRVTCRSRSRSSKPTYLVRSRVCRWGSCPFRSLDSRQPSSSFRVRGKMLQVDLLTPGSERDREPIYIPRFKAAAAPIKHLSLVMQDAQPAVAVEAGATLIVAPAPAPIRTPQAFRQPDPIGDPADQGREGPAPGGVALRGPRRGIDPKTSSGRRSPSPSPDPS